jgi:hypothetical protein
MSTSWCRWVGAGVLYVCGGLAYAGAHPPAGEQAGQVGPLGGDALLGAAHALADGRAVDAQLLTDLGVVEAAQAQGGDHEFARPQQGEDLGAGLAGDQFVQRVSDHVLPPRRKERKEELRKRRVCPPMCGFPLGR